VVRSFLQPGTHKIPMVSALDVGRCAARLMQRIWQSKESGSGSLRIPGLSGHRSLAYRGRVASIWEGHTVFAHAGEKGRFRYVSAKRRPGTIQVDVNYMYRKPFIGTWVMNSVPLGGYTANKIPVVDLREIAAGRSSRWPRAAPRGISKCLSENKLNPVNHL